MFESVEMINKILNRLKLNPVSNVCIEPLNIDYESCIFNINQKVYRHRKAKKTPNKKGYFTVFWVKDDNNKNRPYTLEETPDNLIITVIDENRKGQFIFPRETLLKKNILKAENNKGKMAMRVYPDWETELNKTAEQTRKWQCDYFIDFTDEINKDKLIRLY